MAFIYHHHNTTADVEQYLQEAMDIVDGLDIATELREVAFTKAVDLLSSKLGTGSPGVLQGGGLPFLSGGNAR